jgi:ParB family chromosome partitioning protein
VSNSRLGKGFEALFSADPTPTVKQGEPMFVPISRIESNPDQPRKDFDEKAMAELADSIREKGIIQPIIVERKESGGFVIIAGERRYRAAKMIGLEEVPVIIKNYGQDERLEIALIENIQRSDLNPIEEAEAYQKLIEMHNYTQEQVAKKVGKQRTTIANALRILKLPDEIKKQLSEGIITPGHARAILSLEDSIDQKELTQSIINEKLSVRDAEKLAEKKRSTKQNILRTENSKQADPEIIAIESDLMERYGTRVKIKKLGEGGIIEFYFYNSDDFDRLLGLLGASD